MARITTRGALAWAALSAAGWAVGLGASLMAIANVESATRLDHATALGIHAAVGTIFGGFATLGSTRAVFGAIPRVGTLGLSVLSIGALIAGYLQFALAEWAIRRFGYVEADLIGPTILLFVMVSAVAVASFAVLVGPRGARPVSIAVAAIAGTLALTIVATDIGGLADGLPATSTPLAVAIILSTMFAAAGPLVATVLPARPSADSWHHRHYGS
jgi:hypothetical protein